ncbi:MAG: response regulator [SAR324 cluster bacterium]|nr:response regulator [SAR324 cluster bacterium]
MKKPAFTIYTSAVEAIVVVLLIFLIIGDISVFSFQSDKLTHQAQERFHQEFKLIKSFMRQALLAKDQTAAKQFLALQIQEASHIVKLSALLPDKSPILEYEKETHPKHTFHIKEEVKQANQTILILDAIYDMTELHRSLAEISAILIIGSVILVTIIGICLWITLKHVAILPLEKQILERKKVEDNLRSAKEIAEAANLAKAQFLANMSHEIRTPLNAIVGFSQILLKNSNQPKSEKESKQYLKNIQIAGQTLSKLINNILDLSKVEAGKMSILEEDINLKQFLEEVYHLNKAAALEKKIIYTYDIDEALPRFIRTDRTKLNQILTNLIANAIKFTPHGKRVSLSAVQKNNMLFLQIKDEGIGISKEHQSRIFEPFQQADGTTTRQYGGTGLGLTITRQLIELLGGWITLNSTPELGSTFSFYLPLRDMSIIMEEETALNSVSHKGISPSSNQKNYHFSKNNVILIVEDNPMNQLFIEALFDDLELEVNMADNGIEGIEKAKELYSQGTPPNLILMDIHMPQMDGITATKELRQIPEFTNTPIVALTADVYENHKNTIGEKGFSEFLTKPVSLDTFLPLLNKYLERETSLSAENLQIMTFHKETPDPSSNELNDLTRLSELLEILDAEVEDSWQKITEIITIGDVEDFAKKVRRLGEEYHYKTLEHWGNLLLAQTSMFDMEALSSSLQKFPAIVKSMKARL